MLRAKRPHTSPRVVRLFKNGRSQALRIPKEFELPGKEATIRRVGAQLIVEVASGNGLVQALRAMKPSDAKWPMLADQLAEPVDVDD